MTMQFKPASKAAAKLRLALAGPAGSGKTYTALAVGSALGGRLAVVDTERGSASKYGDLFRFDVLELASFHPDRYVDAIRAAQEAGYGVLVIDSLSHAWMGKDGALELVDRAAKRSQSSNSFAAWREVTPSHNAMVDAILGSDMHVIVTMRSKQEYVQEKDERGRTVIRKVGLAPVQRDGLEYEFDVYADLDQDNTLIVGKTRCPALAGAVLKKPGAEFAKTLADWLGNGVTVQEDTVRNADERIWQRYLELLGEAQGLGIAVIEARLPIARASLIRAGADLGDLIKNRKQQLVSEDAARTAGAAAQDEPVELVKSVRHSAYQELSGLLEAAGAGGIDTEPFQIALPATLADIRARIALVQHAIEQAQAEPAEAPF